MTIKDIAELAQVSKGTVSKALNGQPGVGKATRERILKLVEQLDFHPNSSAQALAFNKTENIGLLIPHIAQKSLDGAYWSVIMSSIVERANQQGYNLLLFTPETEGDLASAYKMILKRRRVDGLIIGAEVLDQKAIGSLFASEIPFVMLGQNTRINHFYVDVDNYQAAYDMTRYIYEKGYRRIAFISGPESYSFNRARILGYRAAISDCELDFSADLSSTYEREPIMEAIQGIMAHQPDAVFLGAGGSFVFDALDELKALNVLIPEMGLASFDDYYFMDYVEPKVTSVSQPLEQMGASAVDMLFEIMKKGEPSENPIIHKATIMPRSSCGENK